MVSELSKFFVKFWRKVRDQGIEVNSDIAPQDGFFGKIPDSMLNKFKLLNVFDDKLQ